ncbi:MAG: diacylglycerol kinase family lipid kinase [Clostridia bacterium]|nr:diacylglycerol kinase family lipid kinase [Clostridia bacterium]
MRPYFIVNPIAGGGKALEKFERVKQYFAKKRADFSYVMTDRAGQSTALAEEAYEKGERYIVAVGGDGTINEVAACLYKKDDVVMGICPFGTGNDFARVLDIPTDPDEAAGVLAEGTPRPVDMGLADDKPFINVGGIGFDVDVVINTEKFKKRFHGMIPYLFGIVQSMAHLKGIPVKITADGKQTSEDILLCAVANGSHFGGGMAVAPEADATDGLFDVCVIRRVGLLQFLHLLPKFVKGRHIGRKPIDYFRASEVSIDCGRRPMQLDGELGEYAPVTFRLVPGALKIMLKGS